MDTDTDKHWATDAVMENAQILRNELLAWFEKARKMGFHFDLNVEKYEDMIQKVKVVPFDSRIPDLLLFVCSPPA